MFFTLFMFLRWNFLSPILSLCFIYNDFSQDRSRKRAEAGVAKSSEETEQLPYPLRQGTSTCYQADDHESVGREIVVVARMDINGIRRKQLQRKLFIRARCRYSDHSVPSAFHFQPGAAFLARQLFVKFGEVLAHPRSPLILKTVPLAQ